MNIVLYGNTDIQKKQDIYSIKIQLMEKKHGDQMKQMMVGKIQHIKYLHGQIKEQ